MTRLQSVIIDWFMQMCQSLVRSTLDAIMTGSLQATISAFSDLSEQTRVGAEATHFHCIDTTQNNHWFLIRIRFLLI